MKETYFLIATIYNEWFGLGIYTRIIPGGIFSLETLHSEWHKNNNSSFKNKLSCLQFIATTVAILASSMSNPYDIVLDYLEDIIPKKKRSLFVIKIHQTYTKRRYIE